MRRSLLLKLHGQRGYLTLCKDQDEELRSLQARFQEIPLPRTSPVKIRAADLVYFRGQLAVPIDKWPKRIVEAEIIQNYGQVRAR